jgi:hypothetical protein
MASRGQVSKNRRGKPFHQHPVQRQLPCAIFPWNPTLAHKTRKGWGPTHSQENQAMSISICPLATIHAPVERVWSFLSEPANYALWWDAQTQSIVPEGPASAGQNIYAQTTALGKHWPVTVMVKNVDEARLQIHLSTVLPWGITVHNHITCVPLDSDHCRVSFG